jgi:hypothetical protein
MPLPRSNPCALCLSSDRLPGGAFPRVTGRTTARVRVRLHGISGGASRPACAVRSRVRRAPPPRFPRPSVVGWWSPGPRRSLPGSGPNAPPRPVRSDRSRGALSPRGRTFRLSPRRIRPPSERLSRPAAAPREPLHWWGNAFPLWRASRVPKPHAGDLAITLFSRWLRPRNPRAADGARAPQGVAQLRGRPSAAAVYACSEAARSRANAALSRLLPASPHRRALDAKCRSCARNSRRSTAGDHLRFHRLADPLRRSPSMESRARGLGCAEAPPCSPAARDTLRFVRASLRSASRACGSARSSFRLKLKTACGGRVMRSRRYAPRVTRCAPLARGIDSAPTSSCLLADCSPPAADRLSPCSLFSPAPRPLSGRFAFRSRIRGFARGRGACGYAAGHLWFLPMRPRLSFPVGVKRKAKTDER